jgi:hypothetical protein
VETEAEHNSWLKKQQSYYAQNHPEVNAPATESTSAPADTTKKITMK